jgi:hypothetical protein
VQTADCNTNPKICIFNDKDIAINGKTVFYKEFFNCGIWFVKDLYTNNGKVVPFDRVLGRYTLISLNGCL